MIKMICKFSMISNTKFPDLSSGIYIRVREKKETNNFSSAASSKCKLWNLIARSFYIGT